MSGSKTGGAENFFERFSKSLNKDKGFSLKILIKNNKKRSELLLSSGLDIEQTFFKGRFDFFTKKKLNKIVRSFEPDIILTWMNRASSSLSNQRHKNEIKIGRLGGYYKLKNYLNCDYLIANTPDIKNYIIANGWEPEKVIYIPNFVEKNNKSKASRDLLGIPSGANLIIGVGRFHPNKDFMTIINALEHLPKFYLMLVGNGVLKKEYISQAKKKKCLNRIKFVEWTNNISKYYNISDILVCSSSIEPLGNVILEAWAHKIPVVASDVMGPNFLIKDKINGMKFNVGDENQLAAKILEVLNKPALRDKLILNSFNYLNDNFSEEKVIEKFKVFFKKVIS